MTTSTLEEKQLLMRQRQNSPAPRRKAMKVRSPYSARELEHIRRRKASRDLLRHGWSPTEIVRLFGAEEAAFKMWLGSGMPIEQHLPK
jgi:hypothetical protein